MSLDEMLAALAESAAGPADELAVRRFRRACRRADEDPAERARICAIAAGLPEP
jgi:hypothetical protein